MTRRPSPLYGAAILIADAAVCSSLFAVFLMVERGELIFPGLVPWAVCLLGCYGTLWLLLQKPRSQRTAILVCLAFFAVQTAAVFWLNGRFAGRMGIITAFIMWIAAYYHCYNLVLTPAPAEKIMLAFEVGVLALLFTLFYCSVQRVSFLSAVPTVVSVLLSLIALVAKRTAGGRDKNDRSRGGAFLAGLAGLFVLAALVFAGVAAGAVKTAALAVWNVLGAMAAFLARCINAFMHFLASLFPQQDAGELPLEEPAAGAVPAGAGEVEQLVSPEAVLYVFLGLAAAVLLGFLIHAVLRGGRRLRIGQVGGSRGIRRQRPGPGEMLRRWLRRIAGRFSYAVNRAVLRNTPPGLFAWLEHRYRRRRRGRRPDETCREFLSRIAPDYPGAEEALETLAAALDAHYFGGGSRLSRKDVKELRGLLSRGNKT